MVYLMRNFLRIKIKKPLQRKGETFSEAASFLSF